MESDKLMDEQSDVLTLTAEIVASYLGSAAHVQASEIPAIIKAVREALSEDTSTPQAEASPETPKPDKRAINKSITPDGLISFVDGKSYKTLKRHLGRHGLDMNSYRERYGLPSDYPSVAPNYSAARSEMAKKLGLGDRMRSAKATSGEAEAPASETPAAAPAKGRRKASAEA